MKAELFVLISSLAFFASAALAEIKKPNVCKATEKVITGANYEKTLCYVKIEQTGDFAKQYCASKAMALYNKDSSPAARKTLVKAGKTILGGSRTAEVFIDGRRGARCRTSKGNGKTSLVYCAITHHFFCEFREKILEKPPNLVKCESYAPETETYYVSTTGIADPKGCIFKSPIKNPQTTLTVDSTVAKENIVAVYIEGTPEVEYLPISIAQNFPNVQIILAGNNSIKALSDLNFAGATKVTAIVLSDNQIETLTASMFAGVPNLIRLDFDRNPLKTLSFGLFDALPKLIAIYMDGAGCISIIYNPAPQSPIAIPGAISNTCNII